MADVIPLAPHRRNAALPAQPTGESAEILFFTGVRYERAAEPQPREAARSPRRSTAAKPASRRKARQPA